MNYKMSASAINFNIIDFSIPYDPGESEKCSGCGRPLNWYGEQSDGIIIHNGWHRMDYAQNSYIYSLCDNCCREHLQNLKT
jgi:hypothetical protein